MTIFILTQRSYVEARVQNLTEFHITQYFDNPDEYNGETVRIDDLIFSAETEWNRLYDDSFEDVIFDV